MLFYHEPSSNVFNVTDPFGSVYSYQQPDPYRLALLKRQRADQARRQREAEELERRRQVQDFLYRRRQLEEEAELQHQAAVRRRHSIDRQQQQQQHQARQLRRQQALQAVEESFRVRSRGQQQEVDSDVEDEVEYVRHPFFGLVPRRRQSQRRQPSTHGPVHHHVPEPVESPKVCPPINLDTVPDAHDSSWKQRGSIPVDFVEEAPVEFSPPTIPSQPQPQPKPSTSDIGEGVERLEAAAKTIQTRWRVYAQRRRALDRIGSVRSSFDSLRASFVFPEHVDFDHDQVHSSSSAPVLEFSSNNKPIHAYEHAALQLLTVLDSVESSGDRSVRKARKTLVDEIEGALKTLEGDKVAAWKRQHSSQQPDALPSNESRPQDVSIDADIGNDSMDLDLEPVSFQEEKVMVPAPALMEAEADEDDENGDEDWVDATDHLREEEAEVEQVATGDVDTEFDAALVDEFLPTALP